MSDDWQKTICILCRVNCGVEVKLDGRHITRVRGNRDHVASKGYACEKAQRIDYYQNGRDRLTSPLRRRPDGTFEEIDWDTAIREVADGFKPCATLTAARASSIRRRRAGQSSMRQLRCVDAARAWIGIQLQRPGPGKDR